MKSHILLTTIAAVILVGCGESQQSTPSPEAKPVAEVAAQPSPPPVETKPDEPVAEAATPEPPTAKAPDVTLHTAAFRGNVEAVKQQIAAGTDVNAQNSTGVTPLRFAVGYGHKEIAELLIAAGADVNLKGGDGSTPLDWANDEITDLLRKHGGKTGEELKAEGK